MPWDARGLPVGCRASRLSLLEPGSSLPRSLTSRFHQLRTDHHTAACALHRKGLGFRVQGPNPTKGKVQHLAGM